MERLTYFENGHWRLNFNGCQYNARFVDRLAAYEDTRLTPAEVRSLWKEWNAMMSVLNRIGGYDRLRKLAEADKDGRVMVLPCKVGNTVYEVFCGGIDERRVGQFRLVGYARPDLIVDFDLIGRIRTVNWSEEAGKTVFLTREEAEEKFKEVQKDDERNVLRVREGV